MQDPVSPSASGWPASVARHGLPGDPKASGIGPLHDDEFSRLLLECEHHRLLGLLGAAVRDEVAAGHARSARGPRAPAAGLAGPCPAGRTAAPRRRPRPRRRESGASGPEGCRAGPPRLSRSGLAGVRRPGSARSGHPSARSRHNPRLGARPRAGRARAAAGVRRPLRQGGHAEGQGAARTGSPSHVRRGGAGAQHPPPGPLRSRGNPSPSENGSSRPCLPPSCSCTRPTAPWRATGPRAWARSGMWPRSSWCRNPIGTRCWRSPAGGGRSRSSPGPSRRHGTSSSRTRCRHWSTGPGPALRTGGSDGCSPLTSDRAGPRAGDWPVLPSSPGSRAASRTSTPWPGPVGRTWRAGG